MGRDDGIVAGGGALSQSPAQAGAPATTPGPAARTRDRLLDIARGLAFLLIFVSHTPGNDWKRFIPGAWGFSDATEIFVFVSGMAVGYAFYPAFSRDGFAIGTLRVTRRIWQVYLAHLCMFFSIAAILSAADFAIGGTTHVDFLNLRFFFDQPQQNLIGLLTLTYVPNLFDILPMYIVILALLPVMVLLARLSPYAAPGGSLALYVVTLATGMNLPAEPWSDRPWFFDPFGWQLLFVLGLSITTGWLPRPRLSPILVGAAALIVILSLPVASFAIRDGVPWLESIHAALQPVIDKTTLGPLRILHFLALAVVVVALVGPQGARIQGRVTGWIERIGQQSLIVFVTSTILAQVAGVIIFETENTYATTGLATVAGFVLMYWTARTAAAAKAALGPRQPR